MSRALTARQKRFVEEYAVDHNGTQAAIRAGYTKKNAPEAGSELLRNPKVRAAVDADDAERSEKLAYTADQVILDLVPLSQTNVANFIVRDSETGDPRMANIDDIKDLPSEITAQIAGIEVIEKSDIFGNPIMITKFKLHDRTKAIALLGKHKAIGAFIDKIEVVNTLAERMAVLRKQLTASSG